MIRRLFFALILVILLIGVGVYFLVNHARQRVLTEASAYTAKIPKLLGEVKPVAKFAGLGFDAQTLVHVDFTLGYTVGESGEVKDVPGVSGATWKARPWDEVAISTALGNVR